MNSKLYLFFLFFIFVQFASAQEIVVTCSDTFQINYKAEITIKKFGRALDFVTTMTSKDELDRAFENHTNGSTRIFIDTTVATIEDDLDPDGYVQKRFNSYFPVRKYFQKAFTQIKKSDESGGVKFTDFRKSNLKRTKDGVFYLKFYFNSHFYLPSTSGKAYPPSVPRVAELIAIPEIKNGIREWNTYIQTVSFQKDEDLQQSTKDDVKKIVGLATCLEDKNSFYERESSDSLAKVKQNFQRSIDLANDIYNAGNEDSRDFSNALSYLSKALNIIPDDSVALALKVKWETEKQKFEERVDLARSYQSKAESMFSYRKFELSDSLYSMAHQTFPSIEEESDYKKNRSKIQEVSPVTNSLYTLFNQGEFDKIIQKCEDGITSGSFCVPEYYYWRAKAKAKKNKALQRIAKAEIDETIDQTPNFLDAYILRAEISIDLLDFASAISDYSTVINKNPDDAWPYYKRALVNDIVGNYSSCNEDMNKAILIDPTNSQFYYDFGLILMKQQKIDQALNNYNKALKYKTDFAEAYFQRGLAYLKQMPPNTQLAGEDFQNAIINNCGDSTKISIIKIADEHFIASKNTSDRKIANMEIAIAIQLYKEKAEYYLQNAKLYEKVENYSKAAENYKKAEALDTANFMIGFWLGEAQLADNKPFDARTSFNRVLEVRTNYYPALIEKGRTYDHPAVEDYQTAIEIYQQSLKLKKDTSVSFYLLGKCYYKKGDFKIAIDYFDKAISKDEKNAPYYIARGDVYYESNEFKSAYKDYFQAITLDKNLAEAYYKRASGSYKLEDYQASISDLNQYIQMMKSSGEGYYLRAQCFFKLSQFQSAAQDYVMSQTLDVTYKDSATYKRLIYSFLMSNQYEDAKHHIADNKRKYPDDPDFLLYDGALQMLLNKPEAGIILFEEAFESGKYSKKSIKKEPLFKSFKENEIFKKLCEEKLH